MPVSFSPLLPYPHKREGSRPLIVTFVTYVSNLSWNTSDESLRQVRLGSLLCVITFLILCSLSLAINDIKAFSEYGNVLDVRLCLLPVLP